MAPSDSPSLDYGCTQWRKSSQAAWNLLDAGHRLWCKDDLRDIEQQLAQSETREDFTVRAIEGTVLRIKNPMFGEKSPIWEPRVVFQEYWQLIKTEPDRPPGTWHCSYLVDWINASALSFRGSFNNSDSAFKRNRLAWERSTSCELLRSRFKQVSGIRAVSKVLCFGLGDFCRKPPEWVTKKSSLEEQEREAGAIMVQHSIALTIADMCRSDKADEFQLLTQDPDYTKEAEEILNREGFSVVGRFGAGGFSEVDDNSVVFTAFVKAPVKQIIADIARPLVIISTDFLTFNDALKPLADADSPRTRDMWEEYDKMGFPMSDEDGAFARNIRQLYIYVRKVV